MSLSEHRTNYIVHIEFPEIPAPSFRGRGTSSEFLEIDFQGYPQRIYKDARLCKLADSVFPRTLSSFFEGKRRWGEGKGEIYV